MNDELPDFARLTGPQTVQFMARVGLDPDSVAAWVDRLTHEHVPTVLAGPAHRSSRLRAELQDMICLSAYLDDQAIA